ncbi:adenosylcobinamide-GDP ribazoletransferase [Pseudooceanicola sp. C21-150M6]|uniref:adenosylcobinamide-GDP ribazoletransferase n=1 Tax=Pseudooceanicola sp. C21-150M6 TaxID=3434355 RepID=UPI003D7F66CD
MTPVLARTRDDICTALSLLTRLPVPAHGYRGAAASWAWPLAGLVLAVLAAFAGSVVLAFGLPAGGAAVVVLAVQVMTTGGMHEDGLADTADGLWGGQTRERRLEIMRDSRIGSYGVIALVLGLLTRWYAVTGLLAVGGHWGALIAAAVLSRGVLPLIMQGMAPARTDGLSKGTGRPGRMQAALAGGIACVIAVLALGSGVFAAMLVGGILALLVVSAAQKRIGGQTGDILGAVQQLVEIGVLFTLIGA